MSSDRLEPDVVMDLVGPDGEVDRYSPVKKMAKEKSKLLEKRRITVDFENMTPA